jgi:aryl-alcohol dehydrogenase-like predicted oxidoreductase
MTWCFCQVTGYGNPWIRGGKDTDTISRVSASQIELSVNESLKRLGTDYIDLLQVMMLA